MTKRTLRLFGEFHLSSDDGADPTALGRRERALLAFLALSPNPRESREQLAALLWSNRGDEQARHSLAQCTAALRKALGDSQKSIVMSEPASLAIDPDVFDIDVLGFAELFDQDTAESLQAAVDLYAGDLLPGLELRSEGFDAWLESERNRFRAMAIDAHFRLASRHAAAADWQGVIDAAGRALAMDDLREDAHRLLMQAYARSGQRALAVQQYKSLVTLLDRELQVGPDAETEALIEDIRAGRLSNAQAETHNGVSAPENGDAAAVPAAGWLSSRLRAWLYWASGGVFVVLLAAVVGVTATFWRVPELAPAPVGAYVRDIKRTLQPHPLSIAILTFESHGDTDAADFAEALSGGITSALSISSEMRVISRTEARHFDDVATTEQEIAKSLNVRYLLEGSVNKWGDQINIETGLIDMRQGRHRVWSEIYRRQAGDFVQFLQDVTFDVVQSLEIQLTEGQQERISQLGGTRSLDAWLAAARGEKHLRLLTPQDNLVARASYERAIEIDPDYAGAIEGLAWTYFVAARFGWTAAREAAVVTAKELAVRALAIDPERPQTISLMGSLSLLAGDFGGAVEFGERAFSLDPNNSDNAALLAYTLTYTGEPQRALSLVDWAVDLRPVAPQWYDWLRGRAYRLTGRHDKAIEVLSAAINDTPASPIPLIELAIAFSLAGETELAERTAATIIRVIPQFTISGWMLLSPYQDQAALAQEAAALAAAGLPE